MKYAVSVKNLGCAHTCTLGNITEKHTVYNYVKLVYLSNVHVHDMAIYLPS